MNQRVAVVTGAAQGIGTAIAQELAGGGATVVIADQQVELAARQADQIANSTGALVVAEGVDVTDSTAVRQLATNINERFGAADIIVNNAGIVTNAPSFELDDDSWNATLAVNLSGTFFISREFGKHMCGRGGAIVNVSSIAGFKATRPEVHVAYDATKSAIIGLTRTLAAEWAVEGIRVNAVAPGYANTELLQAVGSQNPETLAQWTSQVPQHRLIEPPEIARVVAFLGSEAATAITGHVLLADGGYTAW